ncbi:MAG TPA: hypothetical protein VGY51_10770 [Acidimicrobiales bacterium]|jgi:hypothetical protein|nr:hypothetical protein [Acidimicrobiales bacterium]
MQWTFGNWMVFAGPDPLQPPPKVGAEIVENDFFAAVTEPAFDIPGGANVRVEPTLQVTGGSAGPAAPAPVTPVTAVMLRGMAIAAATTRPFRINFDGNPMASP